MKQNWTQNQYQKTYHDQFGFIIHYSEFSYTLEWSGGNISGLKSLAACKEISLIIINDKIEQIEKEA